MASSSCDAFPSVPSTASWRLRTRERRPVNRLRPSAHQSYRRRCRYPPCPTRRLRLDLPTLVSGDPRLSRSRRRGTRRSRGSIPRRARADRLGVYCNFLTRPRSCSTSFATSGSVILLSNLSQLTRARSVVARFGRHAFGIIDNIACAKRRCVTIVLCQPFAEVVGPSVRRAGVGTREPPDHAWPGGRLAAAAAVRPGTGAPAQAARTRRRRAARTRRCRTVRKTGAAGRPGAAGADAYFRGE